MRFSPCSYWTLLVEVLIIEWRSSVPDYFKPKFFDISSVALILGAQLWSFCIENNNSFSLSIQRMTFTTEWIVQPKLCLNSAYPESDLFHLFHKSFPVDNRFLRAWKRNKCYHFFPFKTDTSLMFAQCWFSTNNNKFNISKWKTTKHKKSQFFQYTGDGTRDTHTHKRTTWWQINFVANIFFLLNCISFLRWWRHDTDFLFLIFVDVCCTNLNGFDGFFYGISDSMICNILSIYKYERSDAMRV